MLLTAPAWGQTAQAAPLQCKILVDSIMAAPTTASPDARPNSGWVPVTLPDTWADRWPEEENTVWYRIDWRRDCPALAGKPGPVALTLNRIIMAGEVFINDDLLWRDEHLSEPLSRSWNLPRYWLLPESALHAGVNSIWIRVSGLAAFGSGLGEVRVGDPTELKNVYTSQQWRHRTLFTVNVVLSAGLGCLFLFLWLMRRVERAFGWYALMSLAWVLFAINILATSTWPFSNSYQIARFSTIALLLYVCAFCMFTWRFGRQRFAKLGPALWVVAALLAGTVALAPAAHIKAVTDFCGLVVAFVFFSNCLQFQWHAWRTRQPDHLMLAACLLAFIVIGLYDLLAINHIINAEAGYTAIAAPITTVGMLLVVAWSHARNLKRIEAFTAELQTAVDDARRELSSTMEREHSLEVANARLRERLQIAHDLHDGVGGSLVRSLAMVEQSGSQLESPQFTSILKGLRDDLRQVIDGSSSDALAVPALPSEWLAPLRHRFAGLLDELGTRSTWEVPSSWPCALSTQQLMALTRLLEEALTNVIKHARAGHVLIRMQAAGHGHNRRLQLHIEDDGVGFDTEAVQRASINVGMRSMQARAARVGGSMAISSQPGKTLLLVNMK
ncbi:sensor histidine kinase [Ottowia sp.]|uniref:sensor histidine kinase n=2 Tax=unclassified Ottowia TaxID=2645081 RepID=UPI003C780DCA